MKKPPGQHLTIALLSDVPPDNQYTGGQVLRRIIDYSPFVSFDFYWLNQSSLSSSATESSHLKTVYQNNMQLGLTLSKIRDIFPSTYLKNFVARPLKFIQAVKIGLDISRKLKKAKYDYVWMALQGEVLTVTYLTISLTTSQKVIFQQWDPISWWCYHRGHGRTWRQLFEALVEKLEKRAFVNLVPSQNWKDILSSKNKTGHRIDNFIDTSFIKMIPPSRTGKTNEIHAVFLGQFYSNNELLLLVEALAKYAVATEQSLHIHYFGGGDPSFDTPNTQVHNHGFVTRETLIETIGQWDFALLPYPFDEKLSMASKYSFPSKSRVYVATGLPILAYAQTNSSPHLFFQKELAQHYHNLFVDPNLDTFIKSSCDRSPEANQKRYNEALHVINVHFSKEVELDPLHHILLRKSPSLN